MESLNKTESPRGALIHMLVHARAKRYQVSGAEALFELTSEAAAFDIMVDVASALPWRQAGWKIAATNTMLQKRLRTTGPVCGITFEPFHVAHPAVLTRDELLDPVIECEFFFVMGADLPSKTTPYSTEEVTQAVQEVRIGLEVAECRFPRFNLPAPLYVYADGFASGHYIHGVAVADWQERLQAGIDVTLMRNGQPHGQGSSMDVMNNPVHAVTWLSNWLRARSMGLRAGDVVSSGSCNILASARAGDHFVAHFSDIGQVALTIL